MNSQQAYINGFVKRAAQYGLNQYQAVELLKQANLVDQHGHPVSSSSTTTTAPGPESTVFKNYQNDLADFKSEMSQAGKHFVSGAKKGTGAVVGAAAANPGAAALKGAAGKSIYDAFRQLFTGEVPRREALSTMGSGILGMIPLNNSNSRLGRAFNYMRRGADVYNAGKPALDVTRSWIPQTPPTASQGQPVPSHPNNGIDASSAYMRVNR
jgi:hypothetical protein